MENKKITKLIIVITILIIFVTSFLVWQTNDLVVTTYDYSNSKVPLEFNDYKILQISDLHNKRFGKNQSRLIKHTLDINPDIIVITGDLVDDAKESFDNALDYIKGVIDYLPIFYVAGNHEKTANLYETLKVDLEMLGVIVLEDDIYLIEKDQAFINLIGVLDPEFYDSYYNVLINTVNSLYESEMFNILLSHRPEILDLYASTNVELVFTGHAHGGQVRLPFIGALLAPDQGVFPKYTSGVHTINNTTMVISRGLGESIIPIRTFNRPELVVVNLYKTN